MTGRASATELLKELKRVTPGTYRWLEKYRSVDAISGEMQWKAVLTIPIDTGNAAQLPRRLILESSLQGLAIELPWPLGKRADESRPLASRTCHY